MTGAVGLCKHWKHSLPNASKKILKTQIYNCKPLKETMKHTKTMNLMPEINVKIVNGTFPPTIFKAACLKLTDRPWQLILKMIMRLFLIYGGIKSRLTQYPIFISIIIKTEAKKNKKVIKNYQEVKIYTERRRRKKKRDSKIQKNGKPKKSKENKR